MTRRRSQIRVLSSPPFFLPKIWLGSSQGLSFEICQAMRQILLNSNAVLSPRAAVQMELLVAQGTTDPGGIVLGSGFDAL